MKNSLIATAWLALYRAQKPMALPELYRSLKDMSPLQCSTCLSAATRLGYIVRTGDKREYSYAVTPRCAVPAGVQVLEVLEGAA